MRQVDTEAQIYFDLNLPIVDEVNTDLDPAIRLQSQGHEAVGNNVIGVVEGKNLHLQQQPPPDHAVSMPGESQLHSSLCKILSRQEHDSISANLDFSAVVSAINTSDLSSDNRSADHDIVMDLVFRFLWTDKIPYRMKIRTGCDASEQIYQTDEHSQKFH